MASTRACAPMTDTRVRAGYTYTRMYCAHSAKYIHIYILHNARRWRASMCYLRARVYQSFARMAAYVQFPRSSYIACTRLRVYISFPSRAHMAHTRARAYMPFPRGSCIACTRFTYGTYTRASVYMQSWRILLEALGLSVNMSFPSWAHMAHTRMCNCKRAHAVLTHLACTSWFTRGHVFSKQSVYAIYTRLPILSVKLFQDLFLFCEQMIFQHCFFFLSKHSCAVG